MTFDIMSLNRGRGAIPQKSRAEAESGRGVLKYIDVNELVPSEDNFYSMSAIEELALSIELAGGIRQPGFAVPLGGGRYRLLAGHRRRLASLLLVEQGKKEFQYMPCIVEELKVPQGNTPEEQTEAEELRRINEEILLIATNSQREKTDWDKVQEVTRMRELLKQKRKFSKISGQTRQLIAEELGTTPAQVGRYESIIRHLLPDFQEELKAGKLGVSVAYELSVLPEELQKKVFTAYRETGILSIEDVKRCKEAAEVSRPLPGQMQMEELKVQQRADDAPEAAAVPQEPEPVPTKTAIDAEKAPSVPEKTVPVPKTPVSVSEERNRSAAEERTPQRTACTSHGICPWCREFFDAAELVGYSTWGTVGREPVRCPQCGKRMAISCRVEFICTPADGD